MHSRKHWQQSSRLKEVTVFYVSFNNLQGLLPPSIGSMKKVEQLDVAARSRFEEEHQEQHDIGFYDWKEQGKNKLFPISVSI